MIVGQLQDLLKTCHTGQEIRIIIPLGKEKVEIRKLQLVREEPDNNVLQFVAGTRKIKP